MVGEQLFAVVRTRGAGWDGSRATEGQEDWPFEGTPDTLLVIRAGSVDEIRARLSADPWTSMDLLRVIRIAAWTLRLGSIP